MPSVPNILERQPFQPLPRQTHRGQELGRVAELFVLAFAVPSEFLRHDIDHGRERFEGGFRIEETEAGAAGDHVDGGGGVFAAAGPGDLWGFGVARVNRASREREGGLGEIERASRRIKRETRRARKARMARERAVSIRQQRPRKRKHGSAPASMYG